MGAKRGFERTPRTPPAYRPGTKPLPRVLAYEEEDRGELNPLPMCSSWFHLGIDFISPISLPSSAGNRYIIPACNCIGQFHEVCFGSSNTNEESCGIVAAFWLVDMTVSFFAVGFATTFVFKCFCTQQNSQSCNTVKCRTGQ